MAITFNKTIFKKEFQGYITKEKSYIDFAYDAAEKEIELEKQILIKEFDSDPITQEIESGPEASNTSNTLDRDGNLFSFIGFNQGDSPTSQVRSLLVNDIKAKKSSLGAKYSGDKIKYEFPLYYPTTEEIYNETPMPWGTSLSWVKSIIKGFSNFNHYLYKKTKDALEAKIAKGFHFNTSRSSAGLQTENIEGLQNVNFGGTYKPPKNKYIIGLLQNFLNKIRKK